MLMNSGRLSRAVSVLPGKWVFPNHGSGPLMISFVASRFISSPVVPTIGVFHLYDDTHPADQLV
jgi:hypothetical protein